MNKFQKFLVGLVFIFGLWSCTSPEDIIDYTDDLALQDPEPGTTAGYLSLIHI